jgi:DNA-directed RNA polymerase specialized sigma24 family protein
MKDRAVNLSTSEAELMRLAREGHIGAFAALFELHKSSVYSVCRRSTDTVAEAEDLIQAIFLDVFRNFGASTAGVGFAELLYRAADVRIQMHERTSPLAGPALDRLVRLAVEPISAPRSVSRFWSVWDRMRSARANLLNQHA